MLIRKMQNCIILKVNSCHLSSMDKSDDPLTKSLLTSCAVSEHPWKTNGNYSPSKLYRNGMIEGSPFNVDTIDFIGVFGTGEEDE